MTAMGGKRSLTIAVSALHFGKMNNQMSVWLISLLLSGCTDLAAPRAVDPAPVFGCYVASAAPALSLSQAGVQIAESPEVLPFRYEQAKVGMVLAVPMVASIDQSGFQLKRGKEHFYRVLWTEAGPIIRIAFGPEGTIRDYQRRSTSAC